MDLRKTKLYQAVKDPSVSVSELWNSCHDYINSKKIINLKDNVTGETFMHVLAGHGEKLCSTWGVSVIYLMASSGIDLDSRDMYGDTCLHKAVRAAGTYRVVIALMRCGADPLVRNNKGKTAEDVLKEEQAGDWKQTLHWLNKFKPGLYHALTQDEPDDKFIARLLGGWCRTHITREDGQDVDIASVVTISDAVRNILKKYEQTNEFVIALLAGKVPDFNGDSTDNIDVNTMDHLHEGDDLAHREIPQPLLAAVWETKNDNSVDILLSMGANTTVLYTSYGDKTKAEPLFFHLIRKEERLPDSIVHKVLKCSDMSSRDQIGQTVLFKAIANDYSPQFITSLFKYGVNIAIRDSKGRTASDYANFVKKTKYLTVVDEHVIDIVKDCDIGGLQSLVLQGYDHVVDITDHRGFNMANIIKHHHMPGGSKEKESLLTFIEKIPAIQDHLGHMFRATDSGDTDEVRKLTSRKFSSAQDKCGRTILHKAILNKKKEMIKYVVDTYRHIIDMQDNLGRTALHYAYIITEGVSLVNYMLFKSADPTIKDWAGRTADYYSISVCGKDEYVRLQNSMKSFSMDVYLTETNFEQSLMKAIKKGDLADVDQLVLGLTDKCDINRYANVLFQCLDTGNQKIAVYLIRQGMRTDIYKQYEECSPRSSPCSTYTCNHTLTSLYTRAKQKKCLEVLRTAPELDGRPIVAGPSTMDQFALLGLV